MHRKSPYFRIFAAGILCAASLSACDSAREAMGITKQSPDEFSVVTRAPLTLPPDYGLRPPNPGEPRPQEAEAKDSARGLLVSGKEQKAKSGGASLSRGETALLAKAGAKDADPSIRREIDRESSILAAENETFADRLIFWQDKPPPGTIVDPQKESQRLQENAALGKKSTHGSTPRIERKPKGWLVGLFN